MSQASRQPEYSAVHEQDRRTWAVTAMILVVWPAVAWIISADPSTDPTAAFSIFGAWGASLIVLGAFTRDAIKQRDRSQATVETVVPILTELRDVLRTVTESSAASTKAMTSMAEAMPRIPSEPEIVRLRDVLDRIDPPPERPRPR